MKIIGWDCAVEPKNCGVAVGFLVEDRLTIQKAKCRLSEPELMDLLCQEIQKDKQTLLALDSPLGWPHALGKTLSGHMAGAILEDDANALFRRVTDRFVKEKTGKQPLDVGADRIARTAWATLQRLGQAREKTGESIPLVWKLEELKEPRCIEVYPAVTLEAWGLSSKGYKGNKPEHRNARNILVSKLGTITELQPEIAEAMRDNDDALDAVACVIAGWDFASGRALPPENLDVAYRESWIWFKHD